MSDAYDAACEVRDSIHVLRVEVRDAIQETFPSRRERIATTVFAQTLPGYELFWRARARETTENDVRDIAARSVLAADALIAALDAPEEGS